MLGRSPAGTLTLTLTLTLILTLTPTPTLTLTLTLQSVQLLSSHGADRGTVDPEWPPDDDLDPPLSSAEQCARHGEHAHVLTWLIESRGWRTPLHHIRRDLRNRPALALALKP